MTETETTDLSADEVVPFVDDQDREIGYRAEAVPSSATPGARPAVVAPGAATGRRKEAIARVRMVPGTGRFSINGGRSLEEYFPNKLHQQTVNEPFETAAVAGSYDVVAKIVGGGVTGQAGAIRHGIARALIVANPELRPALKKAGFLARDPRMKERKKYGLKAARRAPQFSKR